MKLADGISSKGSSPMPEKESQVKVGGKSYQPLYLAIWLTAIFARDKVGSALLRTTFPFTLK